MTAPLTLEQLDYARRQRDAAQKTLDEANRYESAARGIQGGLHAALLTMVRLANIVLGEDKEGGAGQ